METATKEEPKKSVPASPKKPTGPDDIYVGQGKFIKVPSASAVFL